MNWKSRTSSVSLTEGHLIDRHFVLPRKVGMIGLDRDNPRPTASSPSTTPPLSSANMGGSGTIDDEAYGVRGTDTFPSGYRHP